MRARRGAEPPRRKKGVLCGFGTKTQKCKVFNKDRRGYVSEGVIWVCITVDITRDVVFSVVQMIYCGY